MGAYELIGLSQDERRTVTEYPETPEEFAELAAELLAESMYTNDVSGDGYSGSEARGFTEFVGENWQVDVINPPVR